MLLFIDDRTKYGFLVRWKVEEEKKIEKKTPQKRKFVTIFIARQILIQIKLHWWRKFFVVVAGQTTQILQQYVMKSVSPMDNTIQLRRRKVELVSFDVVVAAVVVLLRWPIANQLCLKLEFYSLEVFSLCLFLKSMLFVQISLFGRFLFDSNKMTNICSSFCQFLFHHSSFFTHKLLNTLTFNGHRSKEKETYVEYVQSYMLPFYWKPNFECLLNFKRNVMKANGHFLGSRHLSSSLNFEMFFFGFTFG